MKTIDGLKISEKVLSDVKQEVEELETKPVLAIIYTGENAASEIYVNKKIDAAKLVGIKTELIRLPDTTTEDLIQITDALNKRDEITGYIIQLPMLKGIDGEEILANIAPAKDVDGLSPESLGNLWHGNDCLVSATALAVLECLKYFTRYEDGEYSHEELERGDEFLSKSLKGKNVLIINDTLLVGKPLSAIMLRNGATVTIANENTPARELQKFVGRSKIVITATGKHGLINSHMIHEGQILIDVGINKTALGIGGDIDPKGLENMNIWYTPVPNGVGPITVAMLLKNVLNAYKKKYE
ncbi:bifunctional 5,10-methylenetetrahydrofolate dehydrogenase/5,10-methenyltetrahydrofolate cyclohydrolase [Candidatus Dojkabacteria bacterium]|nr:bifunctional 5,10-methylenetetrahydrofolate dehydrogenase/5,10-methenyltetrahydrofolate cyclohydrolase [Candidatus Dojkabacteria bacterium]